MTGCPDCTKSAERLWGGFTEGCLGCAARALARGPHFHRIRKAGKLDRQYRAVCEQFGVSHDAVKAAAAADFETRSTT